MSVNPEDWDVDFAHQILALTLPTKRILVRDWKFKGRSQLKRREWTDRDSRRLAKEN